MQSTFGDYLFISFWKLTRNFRVTMNQRLLNEVRKYPFLYDQSKPDYNNSRKRQETWEQIAEVMFGKQWSNLMLQEKAKKVQSLQNKWKVSDAKKVLERMYRNRQRTSTVQNSATASTSQIQVAPTLSMPQMQVEVADNEDSIRDVNQELLILYLLPSYKLLNEEDKQDILHQLYTVMRERLQSYECQQIGESEEESPILDVD